MLGTRHTWGFPRLRTERPGVGDLPGLGLSSPVLTRWPHRPVPPRPRVSPSPLPHLQKERRLLQNRRLDLDACKARLKKAKAAEAKATVGVPADLPPPALVRVGGGGERTWCLA